MSRLETFESQAQIKDADLQTAEAKVAKLTAKLSLAEGELETTKTKEKQLQIQRSNLQVELDEQRKKSRDFELRVGEATEDISKKNLENKKLQDDLERTVAKNNILKNKADSLRKAQQENKSLKAQLKAAKAELEIRKEEQQKKNEAQQENKTLKAQLEAAKAELEKVRKEEQQKKNEAQQENKALKAQLEAAKAELEKIRKENPQQEKNNTLQLQEEVSSLQKQLIQVNDRLTESSGEFIRLLATPNQQAAAATTERKALEQLADARKAQLSLSEELTPIKAKLEQVSAAGSEIKKDWESFFDLLALDKKSNQSLLDAVKKLQDEKDLLSSSPDRKEACGKALRQLFSENIAERWEGFCKLGYHSIFFPDLFDPNDVYLNNCNFSKDKLQLIDFARNWIKDMFRNLVDAKKESFVEFSRIILVALGYILWLQLDKRFDLDQKLIFVSGYVIKMHTYSLLKNIIPNEIEGLVKNSQEFQELLTALINHCNNQAERLQEQQAKQVAQISQGLQAQPQMSEQPQTVWQDQAAQTRLHNQVSESSSVEQTQQSEQQLNLLLQQAQYQARQQLMLQQAQYQVQQFMQQQAQYQAQQQQMLRQREYQYLLALSAQAQQQQQVGGQQTSAVTDESKKIAVSSDSANATKSLGQSSPEAVPAIAAAVTNPPESKCESPRASQVVTKLPPQQASAQPRSFPLSAGSAAFYPANPPFFTSQKQAQAVKLPDLNSVTTTNQQGGYTNETHRSTRSRRRKHIPNAKSLCSGPI